MRTLFNPWKALLAGTLLLALLAQPICRAEAQEEQTYQAILQDPLTASVCSMEEIHNMVQEMFEQNAAYLGYFKSLKI